MIQPWAFGVGALTPRSYTSRELLMLREYQIVIIHSHKLNHLNTRPRITQPPVTPSVGHLIQRANRTKIETQSSADRITSSISPAHQKEKKKQTNKQKKLSTNLTQCKAYINPWTKFRSAETKRKKEHKIWRLGKGDLKHNKMF